MKKLLLSTFILSFIVGASILSPALCVAQKSNKAYKSVVKPIEGTWINLAYQDVRNKYTNPQHFDNTDPAMWSAKVEELAGMGIKYLVFMAVANDGAAFYPSKLMPSAYPNGRTSPVEAIMDAAGKHGLKVFMSTGWAQSQDDNLRDPAIKGRQIEMLEELAGLYGNHKAMFGWYLPVEDCLGPILSDHAVEAVNALAEKALKFTPNKQILVSPYGLYDADFADPKFEKQLARLKVHIIAYQDEVGCMRERFPFERLSSNWQKLREIHDRIGIELWANCETFTWEQSLNDRTSALIPAHFSRLLNQQVVASVAGVDKIISFMFAGIIEDSASPYQLGQPYWSNVAHESYMAWRGGEPEWILLEASMTGKLRNAARPAMNCNEARYELLYDNKIGILSSNDPNWIEFTPGFHELNIDLGVKLPLERVMMRLINCRAEGLTIPDKFYLYTSDDGISYSLASVRSAPIYANDRHDAWTDVVLFDSLDRASRYVKVAFEARGRVQMDEIFVNPSLIK